MIWGTVENKFTLAKIGFQSDCIDDAGGDWNLGDFESWSELRWRKVEFYFKCQSTCMKKSEISWYVHRKQYQSHSVYNRWDWNLCDLKLYHTLYGQWQWILISNIIILTFSEVEKTWRWLKFDSNLIVCIVA